MCDLTGTWQRHSHGTEIVDGLRDVPCDAVFAVAPVATITEIIDTTGDGLGAALDRPVAVAVDAVGDVDIAGQLGQHAFGVAQRVGRSHVTPRAGASNEVGRRRSALATRRSVA